MYMFIQIKWIIDSQGNHVFSVVSIREASFQKKTTHTAIYIRATMLDGPHFLVYGNLPQFCTFIFIFTVIKCSLQSWHFFLHLQNPNNFLLLLSDIKTSDIMNEHKTVITFQFLSCPSISLKASWKTFTSISHKAQNWYISLVQVLNATFIYKRMYINKCL